MTTGEVLRRPRQTRDQGYASSLSAQHTVLASGRAPVSHTARTARCALAEAASLGLPQVPREKAKPPPPPPKKQKQTKLTPKIAMSELPLEHALLTANPVGEPLNVINAATRFVLVPAAQFGSEGIGGWVAKIKSVAKTIGNVTTLQFKNADGAYSTHHFKLEHVIATFKPLT